MVVNSNNDIDYKVKFIKYTGEYPNMCRGILTLEIDGETVKFGHDYSINNSWNTNGNYDPFWESGGSYGFYNNYSESYVNHDEWIINRDELPDKYKKYASEIDSVFNANVPYGCCGGCL